MKANVYNVKHICGHESEVRLFEKGGALEARLAEFCAKQCTDCERKAERVLIEAFEKKYDAPPLSGSVRQIAWAEALRYRLAQRIMHIESDMYFKFVKDYNMPEVYTVDENGEIHFSEGFIKRRENEEKRNIPIVKAFLRQHTEAAWFIHNRTRYDDEAFITAILPRASACEKIAAATEGINEDPN